jgi:RNA polymerase sigma factor (sigma-70 family)
MDQADAAVVTAEEIGRCREQLLRYARSRLRNPGHAEDAVQDALVAALAAGGRFQGRSALSTWLTGILKHKIVDCIRRNASHISRTLSPVPPAIRSSRSPPARRSGNWTDAWPGSRRGPARFT